MKDKLHVYIFALFIVGFICMSFGGNITTDPAFFYCILIAVSAWAAGVIRFAKDTLDKVYSGNVVEALKSTALFCLYMSTGYIMYAAIN